MKKVVEHCHMALTRFVDRLMTVSEDAPSTKIVDLQRKRSPSKIKTMVVRLGSSIKVTRLGPRIRPLCTPMHMGDGASESLRKSLERNQRIRVVTARRLITMFQCRWWSKTWSYRPWLHLNVTVPRRSRFLLCWKGHGGSKKYRSLLKGRNGLVSINSCRTTSTVLGVTLSDEARSCADGQIAFW